MKMLHLPYSRKIYFLLPAIYLVAAFTANPQGRLINFSLYDQFDRNYKSGDYAGRYTIIIGSDRAGSEYCQLWGNALLNRITNEKLVLNVEIVGVADLSKAPGYLHSFVKGFFPREKEKWILLDWEGIFAESYSYQSGKANICVFDPEGRLILQAFENEVTKKGEDRILNTIYHNYENS